MYRIFLIDERSLARGALAALLVTTGRVSVAGEASSAAELLARPAAPLPDAVLADYVAGAAEALAGGPLAARLILLHVPRLAGAAGFDAAAGWLSTEADLPELLSAIEAVAADRRHVSPGLAGASPAIGPAVSRRELEVMRALAAGRTNHEIAAELRISVKTVDTHRGHLLKKLALRNNSELTRFAIATGYLRP